MSRLTIDELEVLTPDELGRLLINVVLQDPPDFQFIQDLIAVGCPIDAKTKFGHTAFQYAVGKKHFKLAEYLLSNGAEVNARNINGGTILHLAAAFGMGNPKTVEFLLSNGADIHVRDNKGETAWDLATPYIRKSYPRLEPK